MAKSIEFIVFHMGREIVITFDYGKVQFQISLNQSEVKNLVEGIDIAVKNLVNSIEEARKDGERATD